MRFGRSLRLRGVGILILAGACLLLVPGELSSQQSSPARSGRVLVFTRTTGYRHASIQPAVAALQRAASASPDISVETSEDVALFTRAGLAPFGAIVLLSTTGEPLGRDGRATAALVDHVRRGAGLVGIHAATDAYADGDRYIELLGGHFNGHPGDVRMASCRTEGRHPAVARLPATFEVRDEYYLFRHFRPDNQVVVRCAAVDGRTMIPVAWYREEGAGRVFYTCFGHTDETWTQGRLVHDHFGPALLWALGR
jgi:type 1 glutamine amidotransferase